MKVRASMRVRLLPPVLPSFEAKPPAAALSPKKREFSSTLVLPPKKRLRIIEEAEEQVERDAYALTLTPSLPDKMSVAVAVDTQSTSRVNAEGHGLHRVRLTFSLSGGDSRMESCGSRGGSHDGGVASAGGQICQGDLTEDLRAKLTQTQTELKTSREENARLRVLLKTHNTAPVSAVARPWSADDGILKLVFARLVCFSLHQY